MEDTLLQSIQIRALELLNRLRTECGQTSSEYVAVTAVAVAIAITVIYVVLSSALGSAVSAISDAITSFVSSSL